MIYDKWKAKEITGVKAMELMNLKKIIINIQLEK